MAESLFNKVAGLRPVTLLKKRLRHKCFAVNFTKFLSRRVAKGGGGGGGDSPVPGLNELNLP